MRDDSKPVTLVVCVHMYMRESEGKGESADDGLPCIDGSQSKRRDESTEEPASFEGS